MFFITQHTHRRSTGRGAAVAAKTSVNRENSRQWQWAGPPSWKRPGQLASCDLGGCTLRGAQILWVYADGCFQSAVRNSIRILTVKRYGQSALGQAK